jgi:nucleotide-binding universal stress UspA family protein
MSMPVIVTATDFSEVASNAVHYACSLAVHASASVVVVNSFVVPVAFNDMPMPVLPIDESRQLSQESMQKLTDDLQASYPSISVSGKVIYGDITDALEEYAEEQKPWMVILGNSSDEDTSFWLGSNMISALKDLPCPVLAVPINTNYKKVKNICFATDLKDVSEKLPVADILQIVQATGATLHVLNVDHSKEFGTAIPEGSGTLQGLLDPANPQYHFIDSEDIDAGIRDFVSMRNMDWLIVMPHKHGFFEGLFHKSHTEAMARMSHIPLLALHEMK